MAYQTLLVEQDSGVVTITLNRPDALNALSETLIHEAADVLATCEHDADTRAVVITGKGRAFCSGGDMRDQDDMAKSGAAVTTKYVLTQYAHDNFLLPLRRMRKPVIAAINGVCVGGGLGLAMACDLRIAAAEARFRVAYAAVGISPDGGTTYSLPRLVGVSKAFELYLTNEFLSAQEALSVGLVNRVVPGAELQAHVSEFAKKLAAGPTFAFGQTKLLLYRSLMNDFATQLAEEARSLGLCAATADNAEAVEAFLAKRPAQFTGR